MPELDLTLPAILAGGAVTAAAFVTGFTEVLKRLFLRATGRDLDAQLTAAVLSAFLVGLALTGVDPFPGTVNGWAALGLTAILSWYGIMRISMGIYDDVTRAPSGLLAPTEGAAQDQGVPGDPPPPAEEPTPAGPTP